MVNSSHPDNCTACRITRPIVDQAGVSHGAQFDRRYPSSIRNQEPPGRKARGLFVLGSGHRFNGQPRRRSLVKPTRLPLVVAATQAKMPMLISNSAPVIQPDLPLFKYGVMARPAAITARPGGTSTAKRRSLCMGFPIQGHWRLS